MAILLRKDAPVRKLGTLCGLVIALAFPSSARAQSKSWTVCGGDTFATCASVTVSISGSNLVTMTVMNLSGTYGTYAATVFTSIGLYNIPSSVCLVSGGVCATSPVQTAMSGPTRASNPGTPSAWYAQNNKQTGGGIQLDLGAQSGQNSSTVDNGLAGNCDLANLPGGSNNLWMNPVNPPCGTTGVANPGTNGGFVVFSFSVNQPWDLTNTQLLVKGQNGPNGQSTQCFTGTSPNGQPANCFTVPEPVTVSLFATGLLGMGGVGMLRRRRRDRDIETA